VTPRRLRKGRFRGPASSSFRGAAAARAAKGRRRWTSLGVGIIEWRGLGLDPHDRRVQCAGGKLVSGAREGLCAEHPPWPDISEDGEPGSLAIYAQRDFRDSILANIQNQIEYLLEFKFSCKKLNKPYKTRISYLLKML
jgi:hypothetical protein